MIEHDDIHDAAGHDASAQHLDSVLHAVLNPADDPIHDSSTDPWALADLGSHDGLTRGDLPTDAGGLQVADTGGGTVELGEPTLASLGEQPDSVVAYTAGGAEVYSDLDGDGHVDQILRVGLDGRLAAWNLDAGSEWQLTTTGAVDASGHIELWPGDTHTVGGDFVPTADTTTPGTGQHDDPVATGPTQPAAQRPAAPDIELTEPGGTAIDLGPPNQDMDGDGVPESVAVHTEDGHLLIVSDTDGDGAADHVIDIDSATGDARWITITDGEWVEVEHGHVGDDGALVVAGKDGNAPHGLTSQEQLTVTVNGRSFPAGPATIDTDGDGVPDTVAVPGVGGSTQMYQDSNGDGVADRAWTVNADGSRGETYAIDKQGNWVPQPGDTGSADQSGAGLLSQYESGR